MKFGSKKAIFGVIFFGGGLRVLDLAWESATFGRDLPKKNNFFLDAFTNCQNQNIKIAREIVHHWRVSELLGTLFDK